MNLNDLSIIRRSRTLANFHCAYAHLVGMEKIRANLNDTTDIMFHSIIKMSERGTQINVISNTADELVASSEAFYFRVAPWYTKIVFWPSWWCSCSPQTPSQDEEPLPYPRVAI